MALHRPLPTQNHRTEDQIRKPHGRREPQECRQTIRLSAPLNLAISPRRRRTTIRVRRAMQEAPIGAIFSAERSRKRDAAAEEEDCVENVEDEREEGRGNLGDEHGGEVVHEEGEETEAGGEGGVVNADGGAVADLLLEESAGEAETDGHECELGEGTMLA